MLTFLHIDDDTDDLELFAMAVREISILAKCISYHNANLALLALEAGEIKPDYIFLDLNMPGMNGQEFLSTIKLNLTLNSIPVIIFSTSSHPATIQRMLDSGAEAFITKPTDFNQFIDVLMPYVD